jgi:hypothetical protein
MVGQIQVFLCIVKPKSSERGTFAFSRKGLNLTSLHILWNKSPEGRRQYFVKRDEYFRTVVELVEHYKDVSAISIGSLVDPIPCLDGKFSVVSELARNESGKIAEFLKTQMSLTRRTENGCS